jgi:superfamily II RNA helicase
VPEAARFKPDEFQVRALELIREHDVLVSAPTGAGKTWIASQAIHLYLAANLRIWYASPLKALSNAVYQEFCREFGARSCGILTGDRKENAEAPVIVGTTEILRNQLYDAMYAGRNIATDLVILDEAHYLSDPERGVVWEEVLIYLPSRVRLLLLSATISNAEEICGWLRQNRGVDNRIVNSIVRPVPLEMLFWFPFGLFSLLGGKRGLNPKVKSFLRKDSGGLRRSPNKVDFGAVIAGLRQLDLLPAIFFLKSRADCDRAVRSCPPLTRPEEEKRRLIKELSSFTQEYPHLANHRQMQPLLNSRVGAHHGGQLPYWKVLVEKMMNSGYLEAIFSTSTVAAGVNFPARTVVLLQSDRFNGHGFVDLTATELQQMIGRAGRRGKDNIGFSLVMPGIHQDPELLHKLKDSPPEPIQSRIQVNFSMCLNLLLSHTPAEVKEMLKRSLAAFQVGSFDAAAEELWKEKVSRLEHLLSKGKCDASDPGEVSEYIAERDWLGKQIRNTRKSVRYARRAEVYEQYLTPGRLLLHKNRHIYLVFDCYWEAGHLFCMVHPLGKRPRVRKGSLRLKRIELGQIRQLLDYKVDLPRGGSAANVLQNLAGVRTDDLSILQTPANGGSGSRESDALRERLQSLPCQNCIQLNDCHKKKNSEVRQLLRELRSMNWPDAGPGGSALWLSFKRRLRFLKQTGFVDEADRLTPDGHWATKLRVDQPLLIAEAIRKEALDGISPAMIAGGLAPFVWDRSQEPELNPEGSSRFYQMEQFFDRLLDSIADIRRHKERKGFENPPVLFWPAAALFQWANGLSWETLLQRIPVDEGDMASLIMRTADHLRQVGSLSETHPRLASSAEEAIELILREPVYLE